MAGLDVETLLLTRRRANGGPGNGSMSVVCQSREPKEGTKGGGLCLWALVDFGGELVEWDSLSLSLCYLRVCCSPLALALLWQQQWSNRGCILPFFIDRGKGFASAAATVLISPVTRAVSKSCRRRLPLFSHCPPPSSSSSLPPGDNFKRNKKEASEP